MYISHISRKDARDIASWLSTVPLASQSRFTDRRLWKEPEATTHCLRLMNSRTDKPSPLVEEVRRGVRSGRLDAR
jgi:hypothetical protein